MASSGLKGLRWLVLAVLTLGPMLPQDHMFSFLFKEQGLLWANVLVFCSGLATHRRYRMESRLGIYMWQRVGKLALLAVPLVILAALCIWRLEDSVWYQLWLLTPIPASVGITPTSDVVSPYQPLLALSYTLVYLWLAYPLVQRGIAQMHAQKLLTISIVFTLTLLTLAASWILVKLGVLWTWVKQDDLPSYGTVGWFNHFIFKLPIFLAGVLTYEAAWLTSRYVPPRPTDQAVGRRQVLQTFTSDYSQSSATRGLQVVNDYLHECVLILRDAPVMTSMFVDAIFVFGILGTVLFDPTRQAQLFVALPIKGYVSPTNWVIASSTMILLPMAMWSFLVLSIFSDEQFPLSSGEVRPGESTKRNARSDAQEAASWVQFVPYNERQPYSCRIIRSTPFISVLEGRADVLYALLYRVILCGLYTAKARKETEVQGHGFLLYVFVCLLICHSLAAYVVAPLEVLFHIQLNKWYADEDEPDAAKAACLTTLRELKQGHNYQEHELPALIANMYHTGSLF